MDGQNTTVAIPHGRTLIDWLRTLTLSATPREVGERARLALLDGIGCAIFGQQFEWARVTREQAMDSGAGPVTVIGCGRGASAVAGAMANGTAIHSFELDDVILGSLTHAGATVIPAALAAAEITDATGERLLAGIVAGYELDARLGTALGTAPIALGFHTTSVAGPLAAALAACIVAGEEAPVTDHALGIAASTASGIKAFQQGTGGMVKRLHGGLGASNGVLAWQLARRGFDGPTSAIDGRYGVIEVFGGGRGRNEVLSERLGENWAIVRNWTKMYPCCALLHSTAEALDTLRRENGFGIFEIESIRIGTSERCAIQNADMSAPTPMHAQYSIPFCTAVALTGNARDPGAYLPERLHDPLVREMMTRVVVERDDEVDAAYPDRFGTRATIVLKSGRTVQMSKWDAHGTPSNPCSAEELREKFFKLTEGRVGKGQAEAILSAVDGLERQNNTRDLWAALRKGVA